MSEFATIELTGLSIEDLSNVVKINISDEASLSIWKEYEDSVVAGERELVYSEAFEYIGRALFNSTANIALQALVDDHLDRGIA